MSSPTPAQTRTAKELRQLDDVHLSGFAAAQQEMERLKSQIGTPPEGSHPDEQVPRARTWHQERLNWIDEVARLRLFIASEKQAKIERGDMLCDCEAELGRLRSEYAELQATRDRAMELNRKQGEELARLTRLYGMTYQQLVTLEDKANAGAKAFAELRNCVYTLEQCLAMSPLDPFQRGDLIHNTIDAANKAIAGEVTIAKPAAIHKESAT